MSATPARSLQRLSFYVLLALLTWIFVAPLLWMLSTSLKTNPDATRQPPSWIPHPVTTEAYVPLVSMESETPVLLWFFNSLVAATANALLVVATSVLAAYALARLEFAGRRVLFGLIIGTLFIPTFVFLIPNFLIVSSLGWLDSLWALIVPGAGSAFGVFFMRQFFATLPRELEDAALLEGANQWQIFLRIILPLSRPGIATLSVLSFLTNYNDFIWPVYVLFSPRNFTLPPGLSILQGAYTTNYPVIMAGGVVASIPAILLFILAQRHVIEGVSRSGLKG
ncbi:N-Acetyl-D-glucosamine ABC transport system, permease protein 2 [Cystobacter fuscus DSM 2262]|uniref:N-Acetyl-D-glucosamine ABC transport system, permease protein 2 n=1 Tax=Cystobacter fuscus (strain ATCC 25194 / DSM 2262 / NBRC 100088 / M29) TaxID=1242864 RepID=S9PPT6_CYSF2|nr:carbohydrate ABC transporter permease [Cystobacter fuscus]EPX64487.1 N-Acetyl-D-glucosamine ABC transport system, permease protein 2 [Cystobacter fuscus DSM 2262]